MIDIDKVNRRFRAHYYTHGKMERCFDPPPCLLSDGSYPTKIRPEDLPPWYVDITYWNTRYVDTSRVTDILYRPVGIHPYNHLFKDDFLYLSYSGPITLSEWGMPAGGVEYNSLWGWDILDGLFSVREYSGIDILPQLGQLREKILRYNEEYCEPWPDPSIPYDPDQMFAQAEQRVSERKKNYEILHPGACRP